MKNFTHYLSAHCESGALSSLLKNRGCDISETLLFGISGSLFFVHFPFVKLYDIPLTSYRDFPRKIIKRSANRLDFKMEFKKYKDSNFAMDDLDRLIDVHGSVGLQTSVYWLGYFPPKMRFHFNGHNIIVYGKKHGEYMISDPVFDKPVLCSREDLKRARFGKGIFAPKGTLYYPLSLPDKKLINSSIWKGIDHTCKRMLYIYLPYFGYRGIRFLGESIIQWPKKLKSEKKVRAYIG
ncbi:hypothetical protein BVX93_02220, partial [bacterium B13(2017)]